jgi:transcriptional regulator with XRE-family HTH domain
MKILIGDILRCVRKSYGETQESFAHEIGTTQSLISKLERNEISPSIEILDKYAEHFDVPAETFLAFRNLDSEKSLLQKIRVALFKKIVYDEEKEQKETTAES